MSHRPWRLYARAAARPRPSARPAVAELERRTLPSVSGLLPPGTSPGVVRPASTTPNDSRFGDLWGLNNTGQGGGKADADIDAPEAWDVTTGSTRVVVADVDTGIDYTHPDLYRNVWINQGEIPAAVKSLLTDTDGDGRITFWDLNQPANQGPGKVTDVNGNGRIDGGDLLADQGGWEDGADNDANGFTDDLIGWDFINGDNDPLDGNGHGSHTAGTIGALGNNGVGVVGINWKVQVMALEIMRADGTGSVAAGADAIRYAADNGARVSNNSWLVYGETTSGALYQAIQYAGTRDHLVVAAAGNDGFNNDKSVWRSYPASFDLPNIISVAATDRTDSKPHWSDYGAASVDLGAPGVAVWSTVPAAADTDGTADGYASYNGTSMATPHVSGTAALILARYDLSAANLKKAILDGVDPIKALAGKTVTGGRLNAARALTVAASLPARASAGAGAQAGGSSSSSGTTTTAALDPAERSPVTETPAPLAAAVSMGSADVGPGLALVDGQAAGDTENGVAASTAAASPAEAPRAGYRSPDYVPILPGAAESLVWAGEDGDEPGWLTDPAGAPAGWDAALAAVFAGVDAGGESG